MMSWIREVMATFAYGGRRKGMVPIATWSLLLHSGCTCFSGTYIKNLKF